MRKIDLENSHPEDITKFIENLHVDKFMYLMSKFDRGNNLSDVVNEISTYLSIYQYTSVKTINIWNHLIEKSILNKWNWNYEIGKKFGNYIDNTIFEFQLDLHNTISFVTMNIYYKPICIEDIKYVVEMINEKYKFISENTLINQVLAQEEKIELVLIIRDLYGININFVMEKEASCKLLANYIVKYVYENYWKEGKTIVTI